MMSDFEQILERLARLETEVQDLKTEKSAAEKAVDFERLPARATVGKDYVAYRFGCSENSVLRGQAGTHLVRRVSRKPLKFIKSEVDSAWREYVKSPAEIAAELTATAGKVKLKIKK